MCEIGENEYELTADRARRQESTMSAISLFLERPKREVRSQKNLAERKPPVKIYLNIFLRLLFRDPKNNPLGVNLLHFSLCASVCVQVFTSRFPLKILVKQT